MKTLAMLAIATLAYANGPIDKLVKAHSGQSFPCVKSDAEWKKTLSKNSYLVLRKAGTEAPYSGKYWDFHQDGVFTCAACGQPLFSGKDKFDSHTGWPSFFREIEPGRTLTRPDMSDGTSRTEV